MANLSTGKSIQQTRTHEVTLTFLCSLLYDVRDDVSPSYHEVGSSSPFQHHLTDEKMAFVNTRLILDLR